MGFSRRVKDEILLKGFENNAQSLAFLCGLCYSSAEYEVEGNEVKNFFIPTDIENLIDTVRVALQSLFGASDISLELGNKITSTQYYNIKFPSDLAKRMLLETGALVQTKSGLELNDHVDERILSSESGLSGFVSGAYVGCGTSSIVLDEKNRKTTGYHVELDNQNYTLLREVMDILAEFDILAKLTKRKSLYVLYIKDAEAVSNMLALMGASQAVLGLQNEIITRQLRNKINRQNNCYTSNFNKTLNASFRQLDAIKVIEDKVGLGSLPEDLQQAALLRLANTEESLDELLKLSKYPMTKSALNHKFNKIIKLAEKLKGGNA